MIMKPKILTEREIGFVLRFVDGEKQFCLKFDDIIVACPDDTSIYMQFMKAYQTDNCQEYTRLKQEIIKLLKTSKGYARHKKDF